MREPLPDLASQYPLEETRPLMLRDVWSGIQAAPVVIDHTDDALTLLIGSELVVVEMSTQTVTTRSYLYAEAGPNGLVGSATEVLALPDGSSVLIGPSALGVVGSLDQLSESTRVSLLSDTFGAGLPNVVKGIIVDEQPVAVLADGVVAWYDAGTGERLRSLDLGLGTASSAARDEGTGALVIATGRGLVTIGVDGTGVLRQSLPRMGDQTSFSVSDSGRFVAAGAGGGTAKGAVFEFAGDAWEPLDIDLEAGVYTGIERGDPALLNTWTGGSVVRLFQLEGVDEPTLRYNPPAYGGSAADAHPEETVVTVGGEGGFMTFSFETGAIHHSYANPSPGAAATSVRYDQDGDRLLFSVADGTSITYDANTGEPLADDPTAGHDIAVANWNRDNTFIATASSSGTITIRDGVSFETIRNLLGTAGTTNAWNDGTLLFSQDSSMLLTNFDGPPRLWDVETGAQIGIPFPSVRATNSGISVGDDFNVVTASEDAILVWNLDITNWPDVACRLAGAELTNEEWLQWGPRDEQRRDICDDPGA